MIFSFRPSSAKADGLFALVLESKTPPVALKKALDPATFKLIEARYAAEDFGGKEGETITLYPDKSTVKKIVLMGLGKEEKFAPNTLEYAGGKLASLCKKVKSLAVWAEEDHLESIAYGLVWGLYEFSRYKSDKKDKASLQEVAFLGQRKDAAAFSKKLEVYREASTLVRDITNTPTEELDTVILEREAKQVAKKCGLKFTSFDDKKLTKLGCGSLVGVGKGAKEGSKMVILEYRYKTKSKVPSIAFIGKGIVFDSGGLNLKPSGHIEDMKLDKAGAATVLGAIQAIAQLKIPGHFLAVLCCAENAISERAVRPGDVLTAYNGKTIEITNTDAEGRLVLADGLAYTEKIYKPKIMVDIATLTGAATVALGYHISAFMGNNEKLMEEAKTAAKESKERVWELPMDSDFVKATKGDFTDLKNATDGVRAGTSMGGAFLQNFVDHTPWLHIDIGGTAWAERPTPTSKYGATSVMLRTFVALAEKHSG